MIFKNIFFPKGKIQRREFLIWIILMFGSLLFPLYAALVLPEIVALIFLRIWNIIFLYLLIILLLKRLRDIWWNPFTFFIFLLFPIAIIFLFFIPWEKSNNSEKWSEDKSRLYMKKLDNRINKILFNLWKSLASFFEFIYKKTPTLSLGKLIIISLIVLILSLPWFFLLVFSIASNWGSYDLLSNFIVVLFLLVVVILIYFWFKYFDKKLRNRNKNI
jgi:uncharacterized membrane protein YhaH (DUF805 family)